MFVLYADKTQLAVREKEPVTSGSVNVYHAQFEFSDDWDGLTRTAVFQAGSVSRSVLLDESGTCTVPWEVLKTPRISLAAGVCGEKDGDVVLPTVWAWLGLIMEGAAPGEDAQPPTPDLWEQELAKKQDKLHGQADQLVGFDDQGNAVPVDAAEAMQGPPRPGVPPGGSPGQVLTKKTAADYDTQWSDPAGGFDIYSLEEREVGRWFDGKPLYQRCMIGTIGNTQNAWVTAFNLDENIVPARIDAYQWMENGLISPFSFAEIGGSLTSSLYASISVDYSSHRIAYRYQGAVLAGRRFYAVLQYTKTTDQPTIELPTALTAANTQTLYKAAPQSAAAVTLDAGIKTEEV